jgi:hypothetical protein
MTYKFRPLPELGWGVAIAAGLVILQALVTLDPEKIADWRTWAVALGGAAIRAAAGAAIDWIRRSMADEPEPTLADQIKAMSASDRQDLLAEIDPYLSKLPPPPTSDEEIVRRHEALG